MLALLCTGCKRIVGGRGSMQSCSEGSGAREQVLSCQDLLQHIFSALDLLDL